MKLGREHRFPCVHHCLIAGIAASAILYPQSLNTAPDDLRVRVSVTLVQVDAVVTDAHGNHVPGLGRDDFEVYLDGKPQQITAFNFISGAPPASVGASEPANAKAPSSKLLAANPQAPVATVRPEDVRRTIVVFVDDLSVAPSTCRSSKGRCMRLSIVRSSQGIWWRSFAPAPDLARCRIL